MKENRLLIHDLQPGFAQNGNFDEIVEDIGTIKSCIGCFTCWIKTPMECVLKDGYEHMAEKLAACDELTIVSQCTYGGPSAYVKNVLDRSIPYMHPDFVIKNGEMHHKQRFPQHIAMKVIFYGDGLSETEKETAEEWSEAMAVNFDAAAVETTFCRDVMEVCQMLSEQGIPQDTICDEEQKKACLPLNRQEEGTMALISGSPKKKYSTSGQMLEELKSFLSKDQSVTELRFSDNGLAENHLQALAKAETFVISFPLYVDSIPSHLLRCLTEIETDFAEQSCTKSVYAIINCGFYEGEQAKTAMKMVENWCVRCGFTFRGGLGVGAGGMWHSIKDVPPGHGPKKDYGKHLSELAEKMEQQEDYGCVFTTVNFPRFAYKMAGESGWKQAAKKNGITL